MSVPESVVQQVVTEISTQMQDPSFVQLSVGLFVESQPQISRFWSAKAARIGGASSLVHLVFHAQVMLECIRRHRDVAPAEVSFAVLDQASQTGDFMQAFSEREPHLASYVASNIEEEALRRELCRIGLALVHTY